MLAALFAVFFFFNDTATTEIYTLSLHDALPIYLLEVNGKAVGFGTLAVGGPWRSEEHTSELQSRLHLVCRLLLEKKKKTRHSIADCTPTPNAHTDHRSTGAA